MLTINAWGLILASYFWGALSPAYLLAWTKERIDLRRYGSGNVGSSNVGAQLGLPWMFAVGIVDLVKGFAPAALAQRWGLEWSVVTLAGLATVVGHNWSLYLGLRGGRGMAPLLGVLSAWDVRLFILMLAFFAWGRLAKNGALGPLIGLMLVAPGAWLLGDRTETVLASVLLTAIVIAKRLEANRLPLPSDPQAKRAVLWRRLWWDRDVPRDQPWQERKRWG